MKTLRNLFRLATPALLLSAAIAARAAPSDPRVAGMDAYLRSCAEVEGFMGTVLVAEGNEIIFCEGYGSADFTRAIPNGPHTKFRLGSIGKNLTAAAMLRLQEKGSLSIADSISRYFPGFPGGDRITIRDLLSHSSGIPDYVALPHVLERVGEPVGDEEFLGLISREPLEFSPGRGFHYSNSGYVLCSRIIEIVSGMNYPDFMRAELLVPVGMSGSGCRYEEASGGRDMAVGYHYTGEGYIPAPPWHTSWASGAGALYGTVEDLLAWSVALLSGKVMTESSLKTMFAPIPASRGTYGLGWYLRGHLGRRRVYHGGYIFGFRGDLSLYPDDGATIIVLSNVDQAKTRRMAEDLAAILFGLPREAPRRRETKAADPDLYVSLEGEYDTSEVFGEGSIMRVRADGGHVGYRANTIYDSLGLPMYIYPSPDGSFFDRTSATRYRFVMGNDGKAEALIIDDEEEIHSYPRTGP